MANKDMLELQFFEGETVDQESGYEWAECTKYPGHAGFIPVSEFGLKHLPPQYQKEIYVAFIRHCADLTARLRIKHNPNRRDINKPASGSSTGTAAVCDIRFIENKVCECRTCENKQEKQQKWWNLTLTTANHCIHDEAEAKNVRVDFFYDDEDSLKSGRVKTLRGVDFMPVIDVSDVDHCSLKCSTHDEDLGRYLQSIYQKRASIMQKIKDEASNEPAAPQDNCVVIVGHPHGQPKHVTVGEEKESHTSKYFLGRFLRSFGTDMITNDYTTRTCPGNSGAPVLQLDRTFKSAEYTPGVHLRRNRWKLGLNTGCQQTERDGMGFAALENEKKCALHQMGQDFKIAQNYFWIILKSIEIKCLDNEINPNQARCAGEAADDFSSGENLVGNILPSAANPGIDKTTIIHDDGQNSINTMDSNLQPMTSSACSIQPQQGRGWSDGLLVQPQQGRGWSDDLHEPFHKPVVSSRTRTGRLASHSRTLCSRFSYVGLAGTSGVGNVAKASSVNNNLENILPMLATCLGFENSDAVKDFCREAKDHDYLLLYRSMGRHTGLKYYNEFPFLWKTLDAICCPRTEGNGPPVSEMDKILFSNFIEIMTVSMKAIEICVRDCESQVEGWCSLHSGTTGFTERNFFREMKPPSKSDAWMLTSTRAWMKGINIWCAAQAQRCQAVNGGVDYLSDGRAILVLSMLVKMITDIRSIMFQVEDVLSSGTRAWIM